MGNPGLEPWPCRLSGEEVNDPYLVLDQLFDFAHLPQVRGFLWDWLRLTVTGGYNRKAGFRSRSSVLITYEFMEKLVEAAHILHVRRKVEGEGQKAVPLREESLKEQVDRIVKLLQPAQVYFLGEARQTIAIRDVPERSPTSNFKPPSTAEDLPQAQQTSSGRHRLAEGAANFFLALMPPGGRSMQEYESLVENSRPLLPMTVMVKSIAQVNRLRKEGNPFFIKNCTPDRLVYDSGSALLAEPPALDEELLQKKARSDFDRWFEKAAGFLSGAKGFMEMGQNSLAAFMLHQSAEHALTAVLLSATGYREATHNLHKLLQYISLYAPGVAEAFSFTPEEHGLFRQLQKAYTEARYKESYEISNEGLALLFRKVSCLHEAALRGKA
jgi:HEPN domain-containing protein